MNKFYLISAFLVAVNLSSFSQTFVLIHPSLEYSVPDSGSIDAELEIKNTSTDTLSVLVERINEVLAPMHQSYFCWTICYPPETSLSEPLSINPDETTGAFHGWLAANNTSGHDEISYRVYDRYGRSDTLQFTILYTFGSVGIQEVSSKGSISLIGPNPARINSTFSYSLPYVRDAKMVVRNLLGSTVREFRITDKQNTLTIPVADFKSGIYICSLVNDGKIISSRKLVVTPK